MKILFYDGEVNQFLWDRVTRLPQGCGIVDACFGPARCKELLDSWGASGNCTIVTNSLLALSNEYAWDKEKNRPDIWFWCEKEQDFINVQDLTLKEIRYGHNIMLMFLHGAFEDHQVEEPKWTKTKTLEETSVNTLSWKVKRYNCNSNRIEDYDVLKFEASNIKKLKKQAKGVKELFAHELRIHLQSHYWSRCEWELILEKRGDKIFLLPWCGCENPTESAIEVTDDKFDWTRFAQKKLDQRGLNHTEVKIDVWDQIEHRWDEFVDYCWNTRLKYEGKKKSEGQG